MFGLKPLPVILATVAFFFVGFLWYGLLFTEMWMAAEGLTEEDAGSPVWMIGGLIITFMQVIGIGLVLKWKNVSGVNDAVMTMLTLWLLIALPFTAYAFVYLPAHSLPLLMIDASHLLVGWVVSAIILTIMK
ncbi:MAG: DUF1761 domain-containing protein [Marinicaulis sp.]|nr:DUF1761 domain-containing protein [Marinicaulis sp.]NNL88213.1 DUF1761 domain-containing protein [Marinicaulis sp.]